MLAKNKQDARLGTLLPWPTKGHLACALPSWPGVLVYGVALAF